MNDDFYKFALNRIDTISTEELREIMTTNTTLAATGAAGTDSTFTQCEWCGHSQPSPATGGELDVEAERRAYIKAYPDSVWTVNAWTDRQEQEFKVWLKARAATCTPAKRAPGEWISVEDRLPTGRCLATYKAANGNSRTIIAKYVQRFTVEAVGDDCYSEYREDDDTDYLMPGWYECIENWGDFASVFVNEGTITYWRDLPAAPSNSPVGAKEQE